MKDNFKNYLFPTLLVIFAPILEIGSYTERFGHWIESKSVFLYKLATYPIHLWKVLIYSISILALIKLIQKFIFKHNAKEKRMLKCLQDYGNEKGFNVSSTNKKFVFKFRSGIKDGKFKIWDFEPYCINCSSIKQKMHNNMGNFTCHCDVEAPYRFCQHAKNVVISELEKMEEQSN